MLPAFAMGQLHIKSATAGDQVAQDKTYVYNKGEILFVTQEIGMDGNPDQDGGNLYLRDEGQLIQGNNSGPNNGSTNSGTGIVSVYQVNTRNQWDYHYWTSPVGDPGKSASSNGNPGNVNFYPGSSGSGGLYQTDANRTIDATPVTFTNAFNSSVVNANEFSLSSYWLYKFVANTGYGSWQKVTSANPLKAGEGFTMKGLSDGTSPKGIVPIDFRGRPNNGTINVPVANNNLTLVGNPYPSAMNLSFYLLSNSGASDTDLANCVGLSSSTPRSAVNNTITGTAYFWESDPNVKSHYIKDYQGGYGTFSPLLDCSSAGEYSKAVFIAYDNEGERVLEPVPNIDSSGNPIYVEPNGDPTYADSNGDPYPYVPDYDASGNLQYDTDGNIIWELQPVVTGVEGEDIPRHIAPVGQGFFVEAIADGVVTAKNEFRVFIKESESSASQFKNKLEPKRKSKNNNFKSNTNLKAGGLTYDDEGFLVMPKFRITTHINNTYFRKMSGVMFDEATFGFDKAGDGDNVSVLPSDVSFIVEDAPRPIVINIFPYSIDAALPLKVTGAQETNTFKMQVLELNFEPDESIYLYDNQTGEYHDILNKAYEFELPKGSYADRFEIRFKDGNKENLDLAEEVKESFAVYQNNGRAELTILNPLETELKDISVYDITGKLLVSKINEGTSNKVTIPSNTWSDGIYVVRVVTRDNVEYSKKVSVFNKK